MQKDQLDSCIEAVIDSKTIQGNIHYLVKWKDANKKTYNHWLEPHQFPEIIPYVEKYNNAKQINNYEPNNHQESEIIQKFQKISKSLSKIRRPKSQKRATSKQHCKQNKQILTTINPIIQQKNQNKLDQQQKKIICKPVAIAILNNSKQSSQNKTSKTVIPQLNRINWLLCQKTGGLQYLVQQKSGKLTIMDGKELISKYPTQFLTYCEQIMGSCMKFPK